MTVNDNRWGRRNLGRGGRRQRRGNAHKGGGRTMSMLDMANSNVWARHADDKQRSRGKGVNRRGRPNMQGTAHAKGCAGPSGRWIISRPVRRGIPSVCWSSSGPGRMGSRVGGGPTGTGWLWAGASTWLRGGLKHNELFARLIEDEGLDERGT